MYGGEYKKSCRTAKKELTKINFISEINGRFLLPLLSVAESRDYTVSIQLKTNIYSAC